MTQRPKTFHQQENDTCTPLTLALRGSSLQREKKSLEGKMGISPSFMGNWGSYQGLHSKRSGPNPHCFLFEHHSNQAAL